MSNLKPQKLLFQIEIKRILEILSNDIYDSPYALLRENIQNAYDAILMRQQDRGKDSFAPEVNVKIDSKQVVIEDNGIGMDEKVVSNNFWKAGSSGKNSELALNAGVVGTFGIGAMANFGVCKSLKVITHHYEGKQTIETYAKRESLSVTEECIEINYVNEIREPGTRVIAELDEDQNLDVQGAINYLAPYIQYVPIPITINDNLISQKKYLDLIELSGDSLCEISEDSIDQNGFKFMLKTVISKNGQIRVYCSDISKGEELIKGEIVLIQGNGSIYGLRNFFGLAPIPVPSIFNLEGISNLSILHPTAGREALSRDSIEIVTQIVNIIEQNVAEKLSKTDMADINVAFHNYIVSRNRYDLTENIKIEVKPDNKTMPLNDVAPEMKGRKAYYYGGRDQQTILAFGNENSYLLQLSQNNPRRHIQHHVLMQKRIEEVPDSPHIIKVFKRSELSLAEASLILRTTNVLDEDYLIVDAKVYIAEISHQVPSMVKHNSGIVEIYLSRESGAVQQVLQTYETAWEVFGGFVKDFIRIHLYQKFASYIPSSTKQGADALHKMLMKSRELYMYEFSDMGKFESLMSDYVAGEIDFPEVLKKSTTIARTHSQFVRQDQVGNVEQEIPSIVENKIASEQANLDLLAPLPPIMRTETETSKKILKTEKPYLFLNNFNMFLSLSNRIFKRQMDFFLEPHKTKVIWGMHKIVYIFTHASNNLSLYYDIELKEKLSDKSTGGAPFPTTTIITNNKIFIPIINDLCSFFDIKEGSKEFYVRYDIITDLS
ncbi:MAG: chaperone Hsp90 heat shock protein C [Candidatus Scalindua rubra]|uniref:Chaperone Hsp90 heat shock protein C n=1 Tax=Candidatus Scalindua rubra TaxID=1872076 RepID=A0A1E3X8K5_9BACT|nr:MAG: chaperone Hsp90 heat shock protein C [Candidatus Scalindua rubra]